LLLAIASLWLIVPEASRRNLAFREFRLVIVEPVVFFLLMLYNLRSEKDVWRMTAAWLIAAALVAREGVEQFLFGQTWSMEGVGRVTSVYPSATSFGIYVGRALPLAIVLTFFLPRGWRVWRVACALLSVVIALGALFSFARGAWIGVFAGLVIVAIITRDRRLTIALGVAVLAGLALLPFVRVERITSMFNFASEDNTGLSRLKIWTSALAVLRDHPFTGIGEDQFLYQDAAKYGIPQLRFLTVSHPHNFLLDFWLRLGIPGLAWVLGTLTYFFTNGYRVWRGYSGTALGALALGLIASMVDFVVHGLLDMAYFTMDLALTFWLTFGLLFVLARLRREEVSS
jgi:O-antigen ligase